MPVTLSLATSLGTTASPSLAMPPMRVMRAQGSARSLSWPTPDQPRWALPSGSTSKLPLAVLMPQTLWLSSRPACFVYFCKVLPPSSMARVA